VTPLLPHEPVPLPHEVLPIPFPPHPPFPKPVPVDLDALRFRVETNPQGPAIDLVWELPDPAGALDAFPLRVLRRIRRFPGASRQGVVPVTATAADLAEGELVFVAGSLAYDLEETRVQVLPGMRVTTTRQYTFRGAPRDRVLVRTIVRESPPGGGPPTRTTVRVVDRLSLVPGTIYYYTAFAGQPLRFSARTQSSAIATGQRSPDLFRLLPRLDQQRDVEAPDPRAVANADQGRGQLERLLRTVQAVADMLFGFVDGLADLHDPRRVDARLLEPMAALIGWHLKAYLTEEGQRNEIVFANDVYRTLGTKPDIAAMVFRLTGWTSQVKEFADNVVVSWDASRFERLDGVATAYLDGSATTTGSPPALVVRTAPRGSIDTTKPAELAALRNRTFADVVPCSYDCGSPDPAGGYVRNDATVHNRETIGIYAATGALPPAVVQEIWARVRTILAEFLPVQVRPVLFTT
jgi:hypothetical protein